MASRLSRRTRGAPLAGATVLAVAFALAWPAFGQGAPAAPTSPPAPAAKPAAVAPVKPGPAAGALDVAARDLPQTVAVEGTIEAVRQTTLGAQVAGRIVELGVKAGDSVRAGQVLARIDARTADAAVAASRSQIAEAEANLANAQRVHERNRALLAQKFVSQAAVDQSDATYKAAQAQLAAVRANAGSASAAQSFTVIVAPYAGVVGATHAELGDMATQGRPLLTLFDPRELRAVAAVPQATLAKVKLDGSARVDVPALGRTLTPLRATVIPLADSRSHTTRVRLDLPPAEGLLPGQFVRVRFATGTARMIAVPETALLRRGEVTAVYVLDSADRAQLRQVRTGERVGDGDVEILAGLAGGERIAANPVAAGMAPPVAK
jgi:RND family efflux transporter MFP subunit